MQRAQSLTDEGAVDLARECLYRFLAAALSDPAADSHRLALDADSQRLSWEAAELLRGEASGENIPLGFGEVPAQQLDLRPILQALRESADDRRAEYDRVFGLVASRECPPYETEYHPAGETFFRSQQLADVAGFYRAFALEPARATPERVDHIALELEFMAFLLLKKRLALESIDWSPDAPEQVAVCEEALRDFFRDHLAWWVPSFAMGLRRKACAGLYAAVGQALAALVPLERRRWQVDPPRLPLQPALIERPDEQPGCAGCSCASGDPGA
jgi:TorA maturation chaperone TorD